MESGWGVRWWVVSETMDRRQEKRRVVTTCEFVRDDPFDGAGAGSIGRWIAPRRPRGIMVRRDASGEGPGRGGNPSVPRSRGGRGSGENPDRGRFGAAGHTRVRDR